MADVVQKRRVKEEDWQHIADFISDETSGRANRRRDREKTWAEIDRQLRMDALPKVDEQGRGVNRTGMDVRVGTSPPGAVP